AAGGDTLLLVRRREGRTPGDDDLSVPRDRRARVESRGWRVDLRGGTGLRLGELLRAPGHRQARGHSAQVRADAEDPRSPLSQSAARDIAINGPDPRHALLHA